jgi:laminin gamma 1
MNLSLPVSLKEEKKQLAGSESSLQAASAKRASILDNADLDRLEDRLSKAEAEIRAADLDQRIRALTEAKNLQTQWVKNYEDEVSRLRGEVDNINDMRKVLPSQCYKNVRLEP